MLLSPIISCVTCMVGHVRSTRIDYINSSLAATPAFISISLHLDFSKTKRAKTCGCEDCSKETAEHFMLFSTPLFSNRMFKITPSCLCIWLKNDHIPEDGLSAREVSKYLVPPFCLSSDKDLISDSLKYLKRTSKIWCFFWTPEYFKKFLLPLHVEDLLFMRSQNQNTD